MKLVSLAPLEPVDVVVPYIGTWIETCQSARVFSQCRVVPYIGTWIETRSKRLLLSIAVVVPYIGTWIETDGNLKDGLTVCRTLYRYVD